MRRWPVPVVVTIIIVTMSTYLFIKFHQLTKAKQLTIDETIVEQVSDDEKEFDLKTIIHDTNKSVVQIEAIGDDYTMDGSGFIYNEQGDIITNAHVIQDANIIYVRTANARIYPAAVVGIGDDTDIAVVRVPELSTQTHLSTANQPLDIGDEVIALGSPHGFHNTVTMGIISGTERNFSVDGYKYDNVYQISAQITHGNSGGPLISRDTGEAVGINSVGTEDGTIGFSIPIQEVIEQIQQWSKEVTNDDLVFPDPSDIVNHIDDDQLEDDATYLIDYFLEGIELRDYVSSYALLGSQLQLEKSYPEFRDKYIHIVNLEYDKITFEMDEQRKNQSIEAKVSVDIEYHAKDKEKLKHQNVNYTFTIGFENEQLKILNIDSK